MKHPTPDQREAIVQEARDPCRDTLKAIAAKHGVSVSSIQAWLRDGTERKQRTKPGLERYLNHMAEHPHHTPSQAAKALGVSRQRIDQLRRTHNEQ